MFIQYQAVRKQTGELFLSETRATKKYLLAHFFSSELCLGKVMVAYTKPQQRKKEESKRLRGERDQIKFIYLRFE